MNQPAHIPHLPKPPRAWLTLLMGGLLLFSGMVVGAGGSLLFFKNRMEQPDNAPKHFSKRLALRMTRDLNLNDEQSQQVQTIFEAHQEEMHTIRMQIKDEVEDSFESLKTEVEAVLTPEQAAMWEDRIHEYRGQRGPGGHGGPGGPRGGGQGGHKRPKHGGEHPPPHPAGEGGFRPPHPPRDGQQGHYPPPPPRDGQGNGDQAPPPPPPNQ